MSSVHWIASLLISTLLYPHPSLSLNSNCYFTTDDKNKAIDMQSQTERLKYTSIKLGAIYDYLYSPCKEFNPKSLGDEFLVWQQEVGGQQMIYPLGRSPRLKSDGDGKFSLEMKGADERKTTVNLVCDKTKTGKAEFSGGESSTKKVYKFDFVHASACPKDISAQKGLSIGSVLCILFFVGLTFYLAVGVAYRRRFRDAEWRDVVPNKEFWKAYPGLVKDGAVFLWTSVKDARGGYGYSVV